MEIIINKKTFVLKELNSQRRKFFSDFVLPFYNYQKSQLEIHLSEIKNQLEEKFKTKKTVEQIKKDFFKEFLNALNLSLWQFIKDEDKKYIGTIKDLDLTIENYKLFIDTICFKIEEYIKFIGNTKEDVKNTNVESIYAYISNFYGWTFDQIKEMDEIQLLKSIEEAITINKRKKLEDINTNALGSAFGSGSKKAKTQIDKLQREFKKDENIKELKRNNPNLKVKNELSIEQLKKLAGI